MRILLLFHHYRTLAERGGQRSRQIGEYLSENGHEVTVVVPGVDPLTGKRHSKLGIKPYFMEISQGVSIYRVNATSFLRGRKIGRPLYLITSCFMQFFLSVWMKYDIVICTSFPPSLPVSACCLCFLKAKPLIIDVRDLALDVSLDTKFLKNNFLLKLFCRIEYFVYRQATRVFTISRGIKQLIIDKGIDDKKIQFLPIGCDLEASNKGSNASRNIRRDLGIGDKFVALYAGSMGFLLDLMTMLKAANLTKDNSNIVYIFAGGGARAYEGEKYAVRYNLNVRFLGEVSKREAIGLCHTADVCLYSLWGQKTFSFFLGNKVFDYLGAGKPLIFCGPEGDITKLLKESGGGFGLPAQDAEGMAEKIRFLYENPEQKKIIGESAKHCIESKYLSNHSMEKLLKYINSISIQKGKWFADLEKTR
jgi:colanic acid biosynthesis glycosyl transferase WcaI